MRITTRNRLNFVDFAEFYGYRVLNQRHALLTQRQLTVLIITPNENIGILDFIIILLLLNRLVLAADHS